MDELSMDRPTAAELLDIMGETMSVSVVPATAPHAQHQARVVANLCRILARQLSADTSLAISLPTTLLDVDDAAADAVYDDVLELVRSKLAINKPGYDKHGADEERAIIA